MIWHVVYRVMCHVNVPYNVPFGVSCEVLCEYLILHLVFWHIICYKCGIILIMTYHMTHHMTHHVTHLYFLHMYFRFHNVFRHINDTSHGILTFPTDVSEYFGFHVVFRHVFTSPLFGPLHVVKRTLLSNIRYELFWMATSEELRKRTNFCHWVLLNKWTIYYSMSKMYQTNLFCRTNKF